MFLARLKAEAIGLFAIIAAAVVAFLTIKNRGKKEERAKNEMSNIRIENDVLRENLEALEKRADIARGIDALPPDSASKRLRDKWSRDGNSGNDDIR